MVVSSPGCLQPLGAEGTRGCHGRTLWQLMSQNVARLLLLRNTGCKQPCYPFAVDGPSEALFRHRQLISRYIALPVAVASLRSWIRPTSYLID